MARVDAELVAIGRNWWEQERLPDTGMSLAQVVLEYQFQVCAYIVQRLRDPATPAEIRDAFAMRGMPNLGVVLKHPDAAGVSAALTSGPAVPQPSPEPGGRTPDVASVLEAYRTAGKIPQ
jgi:hypothetical protein